MKRNKPLRSNKGLNRKTTGEKTFLERMLKDRDHVSFVSGLNIEGGIENVAHVLPKGKYPELKFDPENVVLLTWKEHQLFDHGTELQREQYAQDMQEQGVQVEWECLYSLREKLLSSKSNQNQSK